MVSAKRFGLELHQLALLALRTIRYGNYPARNTQLTIARDWLYNAPNR